MTALAVQSNHLGPTNWLRRACASQPVDGSPLSNAALKPDQGKIHDIRRQDRDHALDFRGHSYVRYGARVTDFSDEEQICDICCRETTNATLSTPHTDFVEPAILEVAPAWQSIELRTLVSHRN